MTSVNNSQGQGFVGSRITQWLGAMALGLLLASPLQAKDLSPVSVEPVAERQSPWGETSSRNHDSWQEQQETGKGLSNLYADSAPQRVQLDDDEPSLKEVMEAIQSLQRAPSSRGPLLGGKELWVPIVAILTVFGGPILLVIVLTRQSHKARQQRDRQRAETINRLLEAGKDIPVELLREDGALGPDRNLRKGLSNLGIGVGLLLFLTLFLGIGIGSVGFIVIGLGLSQLAVWKWVDSKPAPLPFDQGRE
jgi:hypothetical protein